MPNPREPQIPESEHPVEKVSARAREETLRQAATYQSNSEIIWNNPKESVIKGLQYRSQSWVHSPARLQLMSNSDKRLTKVAEERGMTDKRVERVRVARVRGQKIIYVVPTDREDVENGIEVKRAGSSAFIDIITVLDPAGLTVEMGYKERYDVQYVPAEKSPVGPALMIDLSLPLERRVKTREDEQDQAGTSKATSKKKSKPAQSSAKATEPAPEAKKSPEAKESAPADTPAGDQ